MYSYSEALYRMQDAALERAYNQSLEHGDYYYSDDPERWARSFLDDLDEEEDEEGEEK